VLVISNRKAAFGLQRAQQATPPIPTAYLALQPYLKANPEKTRADYDAEIARMVLDAEPDVVVLAGWMHVMSESFLDAMDGTRSPPGSKLASRMIPVLNLHPALPGAFDGVDAIRRAYDAFQAGQIQHTGVMVHRVIKEVDRGEPVLIREVPIISGEDLPTLEKRVHETEWEAIVSATASVLSELDW
jgi:phosphoribosylglycinamide formyltransferase